MASANDSLLSQFVQVTLLASRVRAFRPKNRANVSDSHVVKMSTNKIRIVSTSCHFLRTYLLSNAHIYIHDF